MEFRTGAMCRLCLCKNDCFFNIFVVNRIYGYIPAGVIADLLHVQVSETDGYPHVICIPCLTKLTNYKTFKEQCHSAKVTFDKTFTRNGSLAVFLPETESCSSRDLCEEDPLGAGSAEMGVDPVKEETCNQDVLPEVKQESVDIADDIANNMQDPNHCVNAESTNEVRKVPQHPQYPVPEECPESRVANIVPHHHHNQDVPPEIKQESVDIEEDEDAFNQTPDPMRGVIPESSTIAERVPQHFRSRPIEAGTEAHIVEIDPLDQQETVETIKSDLINIVDESTAGSSPMCIYTVPTAIVKELKRALEKQEVAVMLRDKLREDRIRTKNRERQRRYRARKRQEQSER